MRLGLAGISPACFRFFKNECCRILQRCFISYRLFAVLWEVYSTLESNLAVNLYTQGQEEPSTGISTDIFLSLLCSACDLLAPLHLLPIDYQPSYKPTYNVSLLFMACSAHCCVDVQIRIYY